jgi:hypothetical protein
MSSGSSPRQLPRARRWGPAAPSTSAAKPAEEPEVSEEERVTTRQIIILWTKHNKTECSLKKSSKEFKKTRTELGVYLYHLKKLLAKTGRNGRWTSFCFSCSSTMNHRTQRLKHRRSEPCSIAISSMSYQSDILLGSRISRTFGNVSGHGGANIP